MESGATELCRGTNYRLDSPLVGELDLTGSDNVVKYWTGLKVWRKRLVLICRSRFLVFVAGD